VFVIGLPFANQMLLNHELAHCRGGDHPVPGTLSLADATKIWHDLGQPYTTPAEWAEIEALADRAGGLGAAEVEAEIARQMPRWVEAGQQIAAELALKEKEESRAPTVEGSDSAEVADARAGSATGLESGAMQTDSAHRLPGEGEASVPSDAAQHAATEAENSASTTARASELSELAAMADI
jgi:hypothetical protein